MAFEIFFFMVHHSSRHLALGHPFPMLGVGPCLLLLLLWGHSWAQACPSGLGLCMGSRVIVHDFPSSWPFLLGWKSDGQKSGPKGKGSSVFKAMLSA